VVVRQEVLAADLLGGPGIGGYAGGILPNLRLGKYNTNLHEWLRVRLLRTIVDAKRVSDEIA
jgi:hypothetical protein